MEELKLFKEQLKNMRPEGWDQIPDIDLYMDQVISYMSRQHIGLEPLGDESLTAAMINNYVKHGLLPRAKGKRYSREHLAYLTAICLLKQVLSVSETGALLEKEMEHSDIRTFYDQYLEILDETFTPFGWRRTHQSIDGNLYCTVEIWDEEKRQWIAKQDVGTTSYSEKEKGQASDSFKRACFNWGLGRELYTAPFIWISAGIASIQQKGDRYITTDRFSVDSISYNEEREINSLVILNGKRNKVFELKQEAEPQKKREAKKKTETKDIAETQRKVLEEELDRTGVTIEAVMERYQIERLEDMTPEIYEKALQGLKKTKTKAA